MANLLPYSQPPVTPADPNNTEEALLSRIPNFSDARKTEYLGYRGVGFSDQDACRLVGITAGLVNNWMDSDPLFKSWLQDKIIHLQRNVGKDILRLQFSRNMHLNLRLQYNILSKAAFDYASLTESELDMLKIYSRLYSPNDLLNMMKATSVEEADTDDERRVPVIKIYVNGEAVDSQAAKVAAGHELLNRFTVTKKGEASIDAEFSVVDDGSS